MARITLTIDADSGEELRDQITSLFVSTHFTTVGVDYAIGETAEEAERPVASATQDAEPGEREARFKRTKDEIARGLTIEQAKAERAATSAPAAPQPTVAPVVETARSETNQGDGQEDPFASPATSSDSPASLTTKDVRDAMGAFLNRDGKDAAQIKDVLHQFKQENGEVVNAASQLQATDYAAFIEKLAA